MLAGVAPKTRAADRSLRLAILAGLTLAPLLVYSRVTTFDFAGVDDGTYVAANPHVLGGLTWDGTAWAFTSLDASNWHPLTWLSLMLDAEIGGPSPGVFHRTNVGIHVVNTLLLFVVFLRMTSRPWRSAFVAGLFALHPLHVESVAWITERKDVLSTFFWLVTMLAYARYAERPGAGRYLLVGSALALGLMTKPMLVTLPLVLVLLDFWPLGRWSPGRPGLLASVREKLPLLALAAASSAVTLVAQTGAMRSLAAYPAPLRLANAVVSYGWYLRKSVWPSGLALLYPYDQDLSPLTVILSAAFLVAVSALAWFTATKRPYLAVGWLWYLGTLVPVSGLVQVGAEPMADRYAYVPLVGIFVAVAWGAPDLPGVGRWSAGTRRVVLGSAAALVLVVLGWNSRVQTGHWRDAETVFRRALDVRENNHRAHNGLAIELKRRGRTDEAILHMRETLRIDPEYVSGLANLGSMLVDAGRFDEAVVRYREALRLAPQDCDLRANLGIALTRQGSFDEAQAAFVEALRLDPDYVLTHKGFGLLLARRGDDVRALEHLERAVRGHPEDGGTRLNLAIVLMRLGRMDRAESELREILRRDPENATAHKRLGMVLTDRGAWDEAIREIEGSLRLDPAQPELRDDLRRLHELRERQR